jgi:hypothetical protein
VRIDELVRHYPRLYHMATEGSWESIRVNGLMTTEQLVDTCAPTPVVRQQILTATRPRTVALEHPGGHQVSIRDQAPLRAPFREQVLVDVTLTEWLTILNNRVFFWLQPERLAGLLNARRYRDSAHDVLTVDTASLVDAHLSDIRLSPMNSGATLYPGAPPRGTMTFQAIADYRFMVGPRGGIRTPVTELAVIGGVRDIANHVIQVERRQGDTILEIIQP